MLSLAFGTCPEKIPEEYRIRASVAGPNNQADVSCNAFMMGIFDVIVAITIMTVAFTTGMNAGWVLFAGIQLYPLMHLAVSGVKYLYQRNAGPEAAASQQRSAQQRQGPESKSAV